MKPTPPLIMIAEGRRPRPRRCPLANPREDALHKAVVDALRRCAGPDWQWTHFPAGERRDVRVAARLKALGLRPGWPDLILVSPRGIFHALELKRRGEDLSEDQEAFQRWAVRNGVPHGVARSIDEAIAILRHWGVLAAIGGERTP